MTTNYHLNVEGVGKHATPDQVIEALERLDYIDHDVTSEFTGELVGGPDWIDYADLALKALLVIAAFVIAVRL